MLLSEYISTYKVYDGLLFLSLYVVACLHCHPATIIGTVFFSSSILTNIPICKLIEHTFRWCFSRGHRCSAFPFVVPHEQCWNWDSLIVLLVYIKVVVSRTQPEYGDLFLSVYDSHHWLVDALSVSRSSITFSSQLMLFLALSPSAPSVSSVFCFLRSHNELQFSGESYVWFGLPDPESWKVKIVSSYEGLPGPIVYVFFIFQIVIIMERSTAMEPPIKVQMVVTIVPVTWVSPRAQTTRVQVRIPRIYMCQRYVCVMCSELQLQQFVPCKFKYVHLCNARHNL